jgi:predicted helicase
MDEYWTRQDKYKELRRLGECTQVEFTIISDNTKHLWLTDGMADDWESLIPLGGRAASDESALFVLVSNGVKTNRDAWAYNFNIDTLMRNVKRSLDFYVLQVARYTLVSPKPSVDDFVDADDSSISWSSSMKNMVSRGETESLSRANVRSSLYRPFTSAHLYFSRLMNERRYRYPRIFPLPETENLVLGVPGPGGRLPFWTIASDTILNLSITSLDATQCFPLYVFDEDGTNRRDNITDWGLEQFRAYYNDTTITKLDVFHYVYGILHDPAYRTKYAANLKRELPRIPFAEDFRKIVEIGQRLMELHVRYEDQPEFPLTEVWSIPKGYRTPYGDEVKSINEVSLRERYRVLKMKRNKKDPTEIIVNDFLTLKGLPANVDDYKLGNRSAIDWVIDQYQISTDKRSGITNDPNREDDPTYIVRLIKKVVTVSVETTELVGRLTFEV